MICVTGMDGGLASVVAGLVEVPVIALPTSTGAALGMQRGVQRDCMARLHGVIACLQVPVLVAPAPQWMRAQPASPCLLSSVFPTLLWSPFLQATALRLAVWPPCWLPLTPLPQE